MSQWASTLKYSNLLIIHLFIVFADNISLNKGLLAVSEQDLILFKWILNRKNSK